MLVATQGPAAVSGLPPFDAELLRKRTLKSRLFAWLTRRPQRAYAVLRRVAPLLRIGGFVLVSRAEDVKELLARNADFPVPFGPKFTATDPTGTNFILGMPDDPAYQAIRTETMRAFRLQDVAQIGALAYARAESLVAAGNGQIDVVGGLITSVLLHVTRQYYGVDLPDPEGALWMEAISTFDFLPIADPVVADLAAAAAPHVAQAVDAAIAAAHAGTLPPETIVARFVAAQQAGRTVLTDSVIRATVTGMIAGFVPTTGLAAGNVVDLLMDRPQMRAACEAAAHDDDDDRLDRCLFEALRWVPINPGPLRACATATTLAANTPRARIVRPGDTLLACTGSAMFDPAAVTDPNRFDPNRDPGAYLHFGFGQHWCVGFAIARTVMTQTFKPLFAHGRVRRAAGGAGQMASFGPFPEHMTLLYRQRRSPA